VRTSVLGDDFFKHTEVTRSRSMPHADDFGGGLA
jgi:hypothetical protein